MTGREDPAREAREDAEWRAIVENFGDRAELPEADPRVEQETPRFEAPDPGPVPEEPLAWEDEGHFVPPSPPPVPRPPLARFLAWFGLFGVPAIALLCVVFSVRIPSTAGLLFIVWFVGGFGYLVATMSDSRDPDSGWDDGAVL